MTHVLGAQLPSGWSASKLKYVTSFLNRGTAPNYVDTGSVRVIGQAANRAGGIDWSRTRFHDYPGDPTTLKGYLYAGDVLINSTGTGTLGRVGYFSGTPDALPCMADGHVSVARFVSSNANSRFAYYWLASQPFKEYVYAALVVGATNQIELNRERLAEAPVPLPPIDEQRRIADFLDAETTRIDSLDRMRSRQLSLLDELVASHIDSAFEREIKERTVRLGYLARVQTGITVDAKRRTELDDVTRPYLRVANVQAGYLDLTEVTEITVPRRMALSAALRYGDVLMTEGGDLDKLGRGTVWEGQIEGCVHQNHVFAVRVDDRVLDPYYLALMTRTTAARRYFESTGSKTTNLASTSSSKIRDFCVPVPALDQQRRTVLALRGVLADMEKLAQQIKRQRQLLAERRTALITAAVTGQFDVTTARGGDLS